MEEDLNQVGTSPGMAFSNAIKGNFLQPPDSLIPTHSRQVSQVKQEPYEDKQVSSGNGETETP
jgi:hypothetical protein